MGNPEKQSYSLSSQEKPETLADSFFKEIENETDPERIESQVQRLLEQWKQDFLSAGFNVDTDEKLSTFDHDKVRILENRLDALLKKLEEKIKVSQKKSASLLAKLFAFESEVAASYETLPILSINLSTPHSPSLNMHYLSGFNPPVTPGQEIDIRELELAGVLGVRSSLNLKSSLVVDDASTPRNEGIEKIANYLENTYFKKHPEILAALDITDIKNITPKQAIQLTSYIVMERIEYSRRQYSRLRFDIIKTDMKRVSEINDNVPIEQLFSWEGSGDRKGVCRNYAEVGVGVLEAIKTLQTEETSLLKNTYGIVIIDSFLESGREVPGMERNHAWNSYVTISKEQGTGAISIDAVVLDATWADDNKDSANPERHKTNELQLDRTNERFFTFIWELEEIGAIEKEKYLLQLFENYEAAPKLKWDIIGESERRSEVESPSRLQIGYRIIGILSRLPNVPKKLKEAAQKFHDHFLRDLNDYKVCVEKTVKNKETILAPLSRNLLQLMEIEEKMGIAPPQEFKNIFEWLSDKKWMDEGGYETLKNSLTIADRLGDMEKLKELTQTYYGPWLKETVLKGEKHSVQLSEKGRKVFLEAWPDKEHKEESIESKARRSIQKTYNCTILTDENSIDRGLIEGQGGEFLQRLEGALSSVSKIRPMKESFFIEVVEKSNGNALPEGILLGIEMSEEEIKERVIQYWEQVDQWKRIKRISPCQIHFTNDAVSKDRLGELLERIEEYIKNTPDHILKSKVLFIQEKDDIKDYTWPGISAEHFLKRDYDRINKLLTTHDHTKYEGLHQVIGIKKRFLDLGGSGPYESIDTELEYKSIQGAKRIYEQLSDYKKELGKNYAARRPDYKIVIKDPLKEDPTRTSDVYGDGTVVLYAVEKEFNVKDELINQTEGRKECEKSVKEIKRMAPKSLDLFLFPDVSSNYEKQIIPKSVKSGLKNALKFFSGQNLDFLEKLKGAALLYDENMVGIFGKNETYSLTFFYEITYDELESRDHKEIRSKMERDLIIITDMFERFGRVEKEHGIKCSERVEKETIEETVSCLSRLEEVARNGEYEGYSAMFLPSWEKGDTHKEVSKGIFISKEKKEIIVVEGLSIEQ